jgi:hypothetical protein
MKLASDVVELVHATVMRMVLDPGSAPGDVPDPGIDFAASVDATLNVIEASYYAVPRAERPAYMRERSREMLAWARRAGAPRVLTTRLEAWAERCGA